MPISLLTVANAFQLPGRVVSSVLTDRLRSRHLHVAALLTVALIVPPFWLRLPSAANRDHGSASRVAVYAFAAVYGLLHGSIVALTATDMQELLKDSAACARAQRPRSQGTGTGCNNYGKLSGVVYTLAAPFMLSGPLISGRLVDTLGIRAVGVWAAGCFALGAVLMSVSLFLDGSDKAPRSAVGSLENRLRSGTRSEPAYGTGGGDLPGQVQQSKGESWSWGCWRVAPTETALR